MGDVPFNPDIQGCALIVVVNRTVYVLQDRTDYKLSTGQGSFLDFLSLKCCNKSERQAPRKNHSAPVP
jgi:hypothetical protein